MEEKRSLVFAMSVLICSNVDRIKAKICLRLLEAQNPEFSALWAENCLSSASVRDSGNAKTSDETVFVL